VIALILFVLLVGLPFAMGMSDMAPCPSCSSLLASRRQLIRLLLFADPPERPPQVV
jgi:hypothetical protein